MTTGGKALVIATYDYVDDGLRRLAAPQHDAEAFAEVLADPEIGGFHVTKLINESSSVVAEAVDDFYNGCLSKDLALLYFTGHGLKDDGGSLYLAMANTRRGKLRSTGLSATQLSAAMDDSPSRRKVLILDCCYGGAFPAGRIAKADEGVQTLARFHGKGRVVLTATDATQYAFEGDDLRGSGTSSLFTRHLVEGIRTGAADLDQDGDIALEELYSYVYDRVVAEMPQQRPKKQEEVDGRIVLARNIHWQLPEHVAYLLRSRDTDERLIAVKKLARLHELGNDVVRDAVLQQVVRLAEDDSRTVSAAAAEVLNGIVPAHASTTVAASSEVAERRWREPEDIDRSQVVRRDLTSQEPGRARTPLQAHARRSTGARESRRHAGPDLDGPDRELVRGRPGGEPVVHRRGRRRLSRSRVLAPLLFSFGAGLFLWSQLTDFVGYSHASQIGWPGMPWAAGATLAVLAGTGVLLMLGQSVRSTALVIGLICGVTLGITDQLVRTASGALAAQYFPSGNHELGPGWRLLFASAVLLAAGVVVVMLEPGFRVRPEFRRDRMAAGAAVVVGACLVGWVYVFRSIDLIGRSAYMEWAGLELLALCFTLSLLHLEDGLRHLCLAALTTFGIWVTALGVNGLQYISASSDHQAVLALVGVAWAAVATCWLTQHSRPATAQTSPHGWG